MPTPLGYARGGMGQGPSPQAGATEVWLVRHGSTEWNQSKRLQGWEDVPLSPLGKGQIERLARRIRYLAPTFQSAVASDLRRSWESAYPLARALGLPLRLTPLLREQDMGLLTGKSKAEAHRLFPEAMRAFAEDPWNTPLPGGESLAQVAARYLAFLKALPPGRHLVVTHSRVIKAAVVMALEAPPRNWSRLHVPNGSLTVVAYPEGRVLALGDVAHLETWAEPAPTSLEGSGA